MNQSKASFETLLNEAFPISSPPLLLETRILDMTRTRAPRRAVRFAFASTGLALVLAGAIVITPRAIAYGAFVRIQAAADALPQWHLTTYTPDLSGKFVKSGETWRRNGEVRDEREFGQIVLLHQGKSVVEYHMGEDHAIRSSGSDASRQVKNLSGFIRELQGSTSLMGLTVDRNVEMDGRQATRVSATSKNEPVKISIYADSSTDVPFLGVVEVRSDHGWRVERKVSIDATPFSVSGQEFGLPPGVRIEDRAAIQQEWQGKLGRPIVTYPGTATSAPLAIRDVWVNRDGLVFVVYTNGRRDRPVDTSRWKSYTAPNGTTIHMGPRQPQRPLSPELEKVEDDLGTTYSKLNGFQGFETDIEGSWSKGLTWPEGDAQVVVYAPVTPITSSSDKLKLQFGFTMYRLPKSKKHQQLVSMNEMVPDNTVTATHFQTVTRHPTQLPEWADFIGRSPKPLELDAEVARVRCQAAVSRRNAASANTEARNYFLLTQMEAAQSGMSYAMYDRYDLLGQALNLAGKSAEAQQAWEHALEDAQGADRDRINKEISTLTAIPR